MTRKSLFAAVLTVFVSAVVSAQPLGSISGGAATSAVPAGAASGELAGIYPNPTLSGTRSGQFTVTSTVTVQGGNFSVGGSTLVVSGGNVGIGTTNPVTVLDVNGSASLELGTVGNILCLTTSHVIGHCASGAACLATCVCVCVAN